VLDQRFQPTPVLARLGHFVAGVGRRASVKHVALLRGVNVGKGARVPMKDLKALLEGLGAVDVVTYLNSGNAVFSSARDVSDLTRMVEDELARAFGERIPTLIKTSAEIISIAASIPIEWVSGPGEQTYVAYLFGDVDEPGLVSQLPVRPEFLSIYYTPGAIVWNIKRADYNRSHITRIAAHSSYARMTTRNVTTARKLAELCAET
jgi:uncharacterized protein (DUF1697 family)